jgi:hypothetical protein
LRALLLNKESPGREWAGEWLSGAFHRDREHQAALSGKEAVLTQPFARSQRTMLLKGILNHVELLKSYVYRRARTIEVD